MDFMKIIKKRVIYIFALVVIGLMMMTGDLPPRFHIVAFSSDFTIRGLFVLSREHFGLILLSEWSESANLAAHLSA